MIYRKGAKSAKNFLNKNNHNFLALVALLAVKNGI
jgi:hypothetical protein